MTLREPAQGDEGALRGRTRAALPPRRSLKAPYIDLIRDGATKAEMRRQGSEKAVYNALFRTALAAVNAGWDYSDWHALVDKRSSVLGNQVATKRNGEDRPAGQVQKTLQRAWARAAAIVAEKPAFDEQQRAAHITAFRTWLADPSCPVSDNQRLVLDAVGRRAAELNVTTPNCSIRHLLRETGLGLTALRTALRQSIERGLLVEHEKGQPWGAGRRRESCHAAAYRLPPVDVLPQANQCPASGASGAPPMVPVPVAAAAEPLTSGAPRSVPSAETVPAPLTSGAPPSGTTAQEEQVTLDELVQAHALIREIKSELLAQLRVELGLGTPDRAPAPVRPLRVVRGEVGGS